jgi:hypothetical protein
MKQLSFTELLQENSLKHAHFGRRGLVDRTELQ